MTRQLMIARQLGEDVNLSDDELAMLQLVADGNTYRQAAEALELAEGSVQQAMWKVLRKLCAPNATNAVATALRRGWID